MERPHDPVLSSEEKTNAIWYLIDHKILDHPKHAKPPVKWSRATTPPYDATVHFEDRCEQCAARFLRLKDLQMDSRLIRFDVPIAKIGLSPKQLTLGEIRKHGWDKVGNRQIRGLAEWTGRCADPDSTDFESRAIRFAHKYGGKCGRANRPHGGGPEPLEAPVPELIPNWDRYRDFWRKLLRAQNKRDTSLLRAYSDTLLELWSHEDAIVKEVWGDRLRFVVGLLSSRVPTSYHTVRDSILRQLALFGPGQWLVRTLDDDLLAWCVAVDLLYDLNDPHGKRKRGHIKARTLRTVLRRFKVAVASSPGLLTKLRSPQYLKDFCGLRPEDGSVPGTWFKQVTEETVTAAFHDALLDRPGPSQSNPYVVPRAGTRNIRSYRASPKSLKFLLNKE